MDYVCIVYLSLLSTAWLWQTITRQNIQNQAHWLYLHTYTQELFILTYCIIVNVLNTHRWFGHIHISHVLGLQNISNAAILQEFPEVDLNYMSHTYIHTCIHI